MKSQHKTLIILITAVVLIAVMVAVAFIPGISSHVFGHEKPYATAKPIKDEPISDEHREEYEIKNVSAIRKEGVFDIPVDSCEGVMLSYDEEAFCLEGRMQYGIFTVTKETTLSISAEIKEGWSFNEEYIAFFNSCKGNVKIITVDNRHVNLTLYAEENLKINAEDLSIVGIYATPDELPTLNINIDIPFSDVTKEDWVEARFELTHGTKEFSSSDYIGMGKVKGRGNRSWKQPKKSYSIKLNEAFSLLDIPETKKYAIVANYDDRSMMKNYITYRAGALLEGMDYMPQCEFVEVYLNGSYNGVYLLVERIDGENDAFGMDEPISMENLDGDCFFEKDISGKADAMSDIVFECPYWANQSKDCFVLQYPELTGEAEIAEVVKYLNNYMVRADNAIMGRSDEPYTQYVDVDSWVDFIIMQEISKNVDGNLKTSCYMYKRAGDDKIYMATLWDFDIAYGGASWDNADLLHNAYADCPTGTGVTDFMTINSSCPWFYSLYTNHSEFREKIKTAYAEYRSTVVPELKRMINEQGAYLVKASEHNSEVWDVDFANGVSDLSDWLNCRIDWLDGMWLDTTVEIDFNAALNLDSGASFVHLQRARDGYPFAAVIEDNRLCAVSCIEGKSNFESDISLTVEMNAGDELSFDYKVSCEPEYDGFYFTVNGEIQHSDSGESDWKHITYVAEETGSYEFHWIYKKDYSGNNGMDCVFIDEIGISNSHIEYETGDLNLDGKVDNVDLLILGRYVNNRYMLAQYALQFADIDSNGSIDEEDINTLFTTIWDRIIDDTSAAFEVGTPEPNEE